jgi:hypothetical protein
MKSRAETDMTDLASRVRVRQDARRPRLTA